MGKKRSFISGREALVLGIIAVMVAVFCAASPTFRTYNTLVNILDSSYYIALMAIGVVFPLITGGVDLSIGTGLACYALVGGYLTTKMGVPVALAMVVTVLMGVCIGFLNGVLVSFMELPPFLATLCTCMITRGLGSVLCGGFGVSWPSSMNEAGWFRKIFRLSVGDKVIPIGIVLIVVLVAVMSFVLKHTKMGRYTIAIGSNKEAARLAGVNVKKYHLFAYVICGLFAGLAGIAYAATYPTMYPGSGAGEEMFAIGGAIVGGVSASGGSGTILGAFLGVLVICLMRVGLPFVGLQSDWQQIITGLVLIGAVLVDILKNKKVK